MKNIINRSNILAVLSVLIISVSLTCCHSARIQTSRSDSERDFMYQYSIIDALMAGVFDGDLRIRDLKQKGDFGVGTFNKVDGDNTTGTCAGFLLPPYLARTNVPGFHLHYIADDLKAGGHIFKFNTDSVMIEVDFAKGFTIENNTNAEFLNVNLKPDRGAELKKIE